MVKGELIVKTPDPSEEFNKRFDKIDKLFYLVIGAMFIGFISMLFMVAGLVIDSWRFNTSLYKEFQQTKIQEENIQNIIQQEKLIIELLENIKNKKQ